MVSWDMGWGHGWDMVTWASCKCEDVFQELGIAIFEGSLFGSRFMLDLVFFFDPSFILVSGG